ncbi:hypothetical protein [Streptomyces sp. BBFR102]|uniref:hypothetical protein n=1 Tax=Streptomyces sp. BBFR102 TaxID=3448171 RepID=UPI003F52A978
MNLGTADGRTVARITVSFANKSSHDTSRRIKRKHLELAQQGKGNGPPVPYGWRKDDRDTVDPEAAGHIRAAQKEVLAGVRISTIRTRWQEEGLGNPSRRHQAHGPPSRRAHPDQPEVGGLPDVPRRDRHGEDGKPVRGEWETINTPKEWEDVCGAIAERKPNPLQSDAMSRAPPTSSPGH